MNNLEIPCINKKDAVLQGSLHLLLSPLVIQGCRLMDNRQTNSTALGTHVFLQALHKMLITKPAGLLPSINLFEYYPK